MSKQNKHADTMRDLLKTACNYLETANDIILKDGGDEEDFRDAANLIKRGRKAIAAYDESKSYIKAQEEDGAAYANVRTSQVQRTGIRLDCYNCSLHTDSSITKSCPICGEDLTPHKE